MIALRSRWDGRDPRRPSADDTDRLDDGLASRDDPVEAALEAQEFVEALCDGMGESAYACVLEQLLAGDNVGRSHRPRRGPLPVVRRRKHVAETEALEAAALCQSAEV